MTDVQESALITAWCRTCFLWAQPMAGIRRYSRRRALLRELTHGSSLTMRGHLTMVIRLRSPRIVIEAIHTIISTVRIWSNHCTFICANASAQDLVGYPGYVLRCNDAARSMRLISHATRASFSYCRMLSSDYFTHQFLIPSDIPSVPLRDSVENLYRIFHSLLISAATTHSPFLLSHEFTHNDDH